MNSSKSINQSFSYKLKAKEENQGTNDHDWDVADYDGTDVEHSKCCDRKQYSGQSTVTATSHEQKCVGIDKIVLDGNQ